MAKEDQLYSNMYSFYKQGNTLEKMFTWLKESYGTNAETLMSGFMKKYADDAEMKDEFNRSCFIENVNTVKSPVFDLQSAVDSLAESKKSTSPKMG